MRIHWRLAKNAIANLGRGSAAAVVALLLPPILIRHMATDAYSAWVLTLQVVAYVAYLDFGLQTAVGRYIAFANEKKDPDWRDGIFSTAFAGLAIAAVLGIITMLAAALAARHLFPDIPPALIPPMRIALLIAGISVALGLPASAWNGVFVGLQRYEVPAITTSAARVLSALGIILAAIKGKSLVTMAIIMAVANLLSYGLQYVLLRRIAPEVRFRGQLIGRKLARELAGYCFSLTVWSFSMLLVTGLDLILVGRFQFSEVTPYAVSATLVTFIAGIQNAIVTVIMPHSAVLHANQDSKALGRLLLRTTELGVLLLLVTGLPLIIFATPIIRIWIGPQFEQIGGIVLAILVIANIVRLIAAPYASILIGTGQQRLVIISPLLEGGSNLFFSILLGLKYGARGVAEGTLIGAVVGMMGHILYNVPRTRKEIRVSRRSLVFFAVGIPVLVSSPLALLAFKTWNGSAPPFMIFTACLGLTLLFSALVVFYPGNWKSQPTPEVPQSFQRPTTKM
jgi:O-antigen/teichoic acid export membrane protein